MADRASRVASLGRRELGSVFVVAFGLRLAFALATGGTYDFDEFVLLFLGREYAHGATPYTGFQFFHPPGMLLLLRVLEPLSTVWWPSARVVMLVADSLTAALVARAASRLYGGREAMAAGLLYAGSPLALISAVRVGQDPMITLLLALSIVVLLELPSMRGAVLAGLCVAGAIWIKYPAAAFVPAIALLAGRRWPALLAGALFGLIALLAPFWAVLHHLYLETVRFQQTRWRMRIGLRLATALIWWLGVNPLAVWGSVQRRENWPRVGFATGVLFLFAAQTYYHYFVPIVLFGALLGGPIAARLFGRAPRPAVAVGVAIPAMWATIVVGGGPSPLYVTAAHLTDVYPTVHLLRARTRASDPVLADRLEYAYLAGRPALDDYFWNVGPLVNARWLERRVGAAHAVVMSYGASSGYPRGFAEWLDRRFQRTDTGATTIWWLDRPGTGP